MEQMYPDIFCDILPDDLFAGRIEMSLIGFSPEPGGLGYYCDQSEIRRRLGEGDYPESLRAEVEEILAFWEQENTTAKVRAAYPPDVAKALPSNLWDKEPMAAAPLYRMAGSYLDYGKLLANGIQGLKRMVEEYEEEAHRQEQDTELFQGMGMALELLSKCCLYYHDMALGMAFWAEGEAERKNLSEMAAALKKITTDKPGNLREAIQLMWLYILISGTFNYGRLDVTLGDYLAADLESGLLTMDQA